MWTYLGFEEEERGEFAGRVGLRNPENSCFVNAGLQCLYHLEPLRKHFLEGDHLLRPAGDAPDRRKHGGEVAKTFGELVDKLWRGKEASADARLLIRKLAPLEPELFSRAETQDVREFLSFFVTTLHDDLNHTSPLPASDEIMLEAIAARPEVSAELEDEFVAAAAWIQSLGRGQSILVDLFQGQLRVTTTCSKCGCSTRRFEQFLHLTLPVTPEMTNLTDALREFLKPEMLTKGNQVVCVVCEGKVDALKRVEIWKMPPVLVLHLQRFVFDRRLLQFQKVDQQLSAPRKMLKLEEFCSSPQKDGAVYNVACVADYRGTYAFGHCTAACQVEDIAGGEWWRFDDEDVTPLFQQPAVGPEAHVVFLQRYTEEQQPCRRQTLLSPEDWPHQLSAVFPLIAAFTQARSSADAALMPVPMSSEDEMFAVEEAVLASEGPSVNLDEEARAASGAAGEIRGMLKAGWLCRRCARNEWAWHWAVLFPFILQFYSDVDGEMRVGEIFLTRTTSLEVHDEPCAAAQGHAVLFVFTLSVGFERGAPDLRYLATESRKSLDEWTEAIQGTIKSGEAPTRGNSCCAIS